MLVAQSPAPRRGGTFLGGTLRSSRLLPGALLLLAGCRESAPDDLIVHEDTTDALVFVKTEAEETLNRTWDDGNLYKLSPIAPDGIVTPITNFAGAAVSDPCVSFDGEKILFSMRPPGASNRNIFEINKDGSGLRQVTSGGGHDFDPLYLPDGRILFTSSRAREMDEYNHAPAEHMHTCNADGSGLERISFNQSDDFDPILLPNGRIGYTRWEHFGTMNRFPLFVTNPDGTGTFHRFGPHGRNFFHPQVTPEGRMIAIESTEVEGDAGPIALLKLENGPADPESGTRSTHWDVLTANVNPDGAPWAYGAFKYPFPLGGNKYVASYTLPAAEEEDADYALYTFTLVQEGAGTPEDPATLHIRDLTFLYNDPAVNEYDAQLLAAHEKPPVVPSTVDHTQDSGVFLAQDVFNRGTGDGQEIPVRGQDSIDEIAVIVSRPTRQGDPRDFSANDFEKRALLGFAPVYSDGSFKIRVPADTPIAFATLDDQNRGFVVKRTWLYVRPGESFTNCVGCHEHRSTGEPIVTNPNPIAASQPATDLNVDPSGYRIINYENDIGPIVAAKCAVCHFTTITERTLFDEDTGLVTGTGLFDTTLAPANLDLTAVPDTVRMNEIFPRGYVNLSGEMMGDGPQVTVPAFPRRSVLVDAMLGLGDHQGAAHPAAPYALTDLEKELFNYWVLLGAQYK